MAYVRKTRDEYEVQGYFCPECGWEIVACDETKREALNTLRDYRVNDPGHAYRIRKIRVKIEA